MERVERCSRPLADQGLGAGVESKRRGKQQRGREKEAAWMGGEGGVHQ